MRHCEAQDRGFTLLEVVVSLAILALCLSVLLRIFSQTAGSTRIADDYYQAVQIAERELARHASQPGRALTERGDDDDYFFWQVRIEEYRQPQLQGLPASIDLERTWDLYQVEVEVNWGGFRSRSLVLSTLRLGDRL